MAEPAVETTDLTRYFGKVHAVDGLTLSVPKGAIYGFLGPNGAGKTTTIHLLLGMLGPTRGSARVLGLDPATQGRDVRRRTGALLEHHGLYERLSAEENLELYARIHRMPAADRGARIRELLDALGLWDRRDEPAGTWSRGMKQKLAVARALIHRPELVFLDEPTAGQDPAGAAAFRDDIGRLAKQEGVTIFLTTHNLSEAERLCHRVGIVRAGRLVAEGPPDRLVQEGKRPRLEVHGTGFTPKVLAGLKRRDDVKAVLGANGTLRIELVVGASSAPVVAWLVKAGAQVEEVRRADAHLEDAFLDLVREEPRA